MNRLLLILVLLIVPANVPSKEKVGDHRVSAASHMAKEFSTLGIHRMYVPDFCDDPSRLNDRGAFFADMFSMLLAKKAKGFVVESRVEAHRFLQQNNLTDCDLNRPEVLSKLSSTFSVDSMLFANLSVGKDSYSLDFFLRDLSGEELSRSHYSESRYAETEALFPGIAAPSGWPFYFSLLDGIREVSEMP